MIVTYTEVPSVAGGTPRPLLDMVVADMFDAPVPCWVDSGAVINTLLPAWLADAAGIDLVDPDTRGLAVAGLETAATFTTTSLTVGDFRWEARVAFCSPWPYSWGLLGHDAFFRYFTVTFRAADYEFDLQPVER